MVDLTVWAVEAARSWVPPGMFEERLGATAREFPLKLGAGDVKGLVLAWAPLLELAPGFGVSVSGLLAAACFGPTAAVERSCAN